MTDERELLARYGNFEAAYEMRQWEEFVREHPERGDELARAVYFHTDDHRWDWLLAMQSRRKRVPPILAALDPRPGERIMDLACHAGTFVHLCAEAGAEVVGVDLDVSYARSLLEPYGHLRYELATGDATALRFPDGSFDKVLCADLLEHLTPEEKRRCLAEMLRVVRPGGRIVISTPNSYRVKAGIAYRIVRDVLHGRAPRRYGDPFCGSDCHAGAGHIGITSLRALRSILRSVGPRVRVRQGYTSADLPWFRRRMPVVGEALGRWIPGVRDLLTGMILIVIEVPS